MKLNFNFLKSPFILITIITLLKNIKTPSNIRELFSNEIKDYICEKAGQSLMNKYKNGFDEKIMNIKAELNEEQRAFIKYIKHSKYENIKPYIKRIGIYIALLVLNVIFIILWILFDIFCYKKTFISKKRKLTKIKFIIYSSIVLVFNLSIIIFSIIILIQIIPFFEKVNGLGCSIMIFFDHIVYGLSPLYPLESQQWQGFIGIIEKFRESQEKYNNLNYDKIEEAFRTVKSIYDANSQTECLSPFINIEGDKLLFRTSIESIFKDIDFDKIIKFHFPSQSPITKLKILNSRSRGLGPIKKLSS